jgi:uncharacterized protein
MSSTKKTAFLKNFWKSTSNIILQNRKMWLGIISIITVFMVFMITKLEMSYELARILPQSDNNHKLYEKFKERFGEDGNVLVVAFESDKLYDIKIFNQWYDLSKEIKSINGIKNVASTATLYEVVKNQSLNKLELKPLVPKRPEIQSEIDSIKANIEKYPFYKGFIYSNDSKAHLMAITFSQSKLNSKERITMTRNIQAKAEAFGAKNDIKMHFSGMPFIRTNFMAKVSKELGMFMVLAFLVTTLILFLFFRSLKTVFYAVFVVLIAVIWSVGFISLLNYKITILTGLIPPLIIVIGIPNTIFLINKYQEEYIRLKDKFKALQITIEKIGKTTFLANVTTFIGFIVFYFTGSPLLLEFGLVAAICVMATWVISLILIPIIFSYTSVPNDKHIRHLDNKNITKILDYVNFIVHQRRTNLYWFIIALVAISIYGITKIKALGYVVDDLPEKDPIYTDLKFIEKHFQGVIPFELAIDTKKPDGVFDPIVLNKIKIAQKEFAKHPEFTKPVSVVEGIKFVYQGFRGGDPKYYTLPGALELQKLGEFGATAKGKENLFNSIIDSTKRFTRVSFQTGDVGTVRMKELIDTLQAKVDTIFNYDRELAKWKPQSEQIEATLTGNGVVFTKGNDYLLGNLRDSTILAIILVSMVMATQFLNYRTILISTIPSIIPLIITAGIMGYFNIPLKPSTTLIFSIAFGIASDGTIYFLTKYKDEILSGKSIGEAVTHTIKFTGISMFYTAIILFFGFGIFIASGFKGTIFLGLLVSVTLLIGMISNLVLLPAFLMTMDKKQTKKALKKNGR